MSANESGTGVQIILVTRNTLIAPDSIEIQLSYQSSKRELTIRTKNVSDIICFSQFMI